MRLKRHYKKPEGWVKQVNVRDPETGELVNPLIPEGECLNVPPLDYIELQHTGSTPGQNFSASLVAAGLVEGWMSIQGGVLTMRVQPQDLAYKILRVPGKYPSKTERSGYEVIHHYECMLDGTQHATFCAKTEDDRREAAYLLKGITPKRKSHIKEVARG